MVISTPFGIAMGRIPIRDIVRSSSAGGPAVAAGYVYAGALRGAGDTRWPLLVKLISPWLVRVPLAFWLIPAYGLPGAWVAMTIDLALQGLLSYWRFRGSRWEQIPI